METILIKTAQLLLSLSILVVLHEFGHFMFARLFKTRVEKFYLFFNPWFSLFKVKKGDTEYGIGWLPLGGYVKISGMIDESMDKEAMKLPIQYALGFPSRIKNKYPRFNFLDYPTLDFEPPNTKIFRNLALSFEAMKSGGNMPCILNAANEVVVEAFLNNKVAFLQMPDIIEKVMQKVTFIEKPTLENLIETNSETRSVTKLLTNN